MITCHDVQDGQDTRADLRLAAAEQARRDLVDYIMEQACNHLRTKDRSKEKQEAVDRVREVKVGN